MKNNLIILILLLISSTGCNRSENSKIDLSGEWQFRMDPDDRGIEEKWYEQDFSETVQLPGSMVENGKGFDITLETKWTGGVRNPEWNKDPNYAPYVDPDNVRFPYWLQPIKKYTGAAWYQKKVTVPAKWKDKNIGLKLERPHWESQIWINGDWVEMQNSLAIPHVFDVSEFLEPGENILAVRIDNRIKDIDPGFNSHSITDHTQSNWNGIVGEISLETKGNIVFENVKIFPDINEKTIEINATVNNKTKEIQKAKITALTQLKKSAKK
jgi:beta-galactosidase/beta-glucuronidase